MALRRQFRGAADFSEGLARVDRGFIDRQGSLEIAAYFTDATSFPEGLAAVAQDYKWVSRKPAGSSPGKRPASKGGNSETTEQKPGTSTLSIKR
jgi:hypothetical protein